jgi:hypothetical protein
MFHAALQNVVSCRATGGGYVRRVGTGSPSVPTDKIDPASLPPDAWSPNGSRRTTMLKVTRLGLAVALVVGSASLALAQSPENGSVPTLPNAATIYQDGVVVRQLTPRQERRQARHSEQNSASDQPWSSSFDPGNTSGGD